MRIGLNQIGLDHIRYLWQQKWMIDNNVTHHISGNNRSSSGSSSRTIKRIETELYYKCLILIINFHTT